MKTHTRTLLMFEPTKDIEAVSLSTRTESGHRTEGRFRFISGFFLPLVLLCVCWLYPNSPLKAADSPVKSFEPVPLVAKSSTELLSSTYGQFIGHSSDAIVVAGGLRLPEGAKSLANAESVNRVDVYANKKWQTRELYSIAAFGAVASDGAKMYLVGGIREGRPVDEVLALEWINDDLTSSSLPALPCPLALASATTVNGTIYVAGGATSLKPLVFNDSVWTLNLAFPQKGWNALDGYGGEDSSQMHRLRPAVGHQFQNLVILGGWRTAEDGTFRSLSDGLRLVQKPGKQVSWSVIAPLENGLTLGAASAITPGESHVLLLGLERRSEAQTLFDLLTGPDPGRPEVLAYHIITDTWTIYGKISDGRNELNVPASCQVLPWTQVAESEDTISENAYAMIGGRTDAGKPSSSVCTFKLEYAKSQFGGLEYVILGIYLAILLGIGIFFLRKERSSEEFFLGGRRVPWWAVGISIYGTSTSAISFMAIPAMTYATDWLYIGGPLATIISTIIVGYVFVPLLRSLSFTTIYEYIQQRFNTTVRLAGSVTGLVFLVGGRMSVILFLPSLALSAVTGIDVQTSILIMGVLATLYTVMGGIQAVIWTDVLQVLIMFGGAILSIVLILLHVDGGLTSASEILSANAKLRSFELSFDLTVPSVAVLFAVVFGFIFQYVGDQPNMQRILSTSDVKSARRSVVLMALVAIPGTLIFYSLGSILFVFFHQYPSHLSPVLKNDAIFPLYIAQELPTGVKGILIASLFAASMSTLDSSMNSAAAIVVTDFIRPYKKKITERHMLVCARVITVIAGAAGTGFALYMSYVEDLGMLWDVFLKLQGLLGGGFAGVFALGMMTRRANSWGTLIGLVGSVVVLLFCQKTALTGWLYLPIAVISCMVIGYFASIAIPGKKRDLGGLTIFTLSRTSKITGNS